MKIGLLLSIFIIAAAVSTFADEPITVEANSGMQICDPVWIEKDIPVTFHVRGQWSMWHNTWLPVDSQGHRSFKKINDFYLGALIGFVIGGEEFQVTDGMHYTSQVSGYLVLYPNRGNYKHLEVDGSLTIEVDGALIRRKLIATDEQTVIDAYKDNYPGSLISISDFFWNGSVKQCNPGWVPQDVLDKALMRINYFRESVGVYPVVFDESLNSFAQAGALMLLANHDIPGTHTPPKNWNCWSEDGAFGLKGSNISRSSFQNLITNCIRDHGNNRPVGHRRWLLSTRAAAFGYGITYDPSIEDAAHEAIYVIDHYTKIATNTIPDTSIKPEYIAYPPAGWFPINLIFYRFSFGLPVTPGRIDWSKTDVEMVDSWGTRIDISIYGRKKSEITGAGDPTISWDVVGGKDTIFNILKKNISRELSITISNIILDGEFRSYSYKVIPIIIPE